MTSLAGRTLLRAAEMLQADACALADAERVNRPNCDLANRASATFSVYQRAWVERSSASTLCVALWPANGRGDQRSSAGLPAGARRARAGRGMSPSNTRITRSNPTMAGSRPGYGRCADSNAWRPRAPSPPGMPSYRICATATTRSPPTCPGKIGSASHSTSWPWHSDQYRTAGGPGRSMLCLHQRNSARGSSRHERRRHESSEGQCEP